jgi:hypothetical protein
MRCRDVFGRSGCFDQFWGEIHSKLTYLHGEPRLSPAGKAPQATPFEDCLTFLSSCSDQHFLDFVEFIFAVEATWLVGREELVDDINQFLLVDDLPYAVTPFVWTKGISQFHGQPRESTKLTALPQVIRKDSQVVFQTATDPALSLLRESRFAAANAEFLAALKDYRSGEYGDCLVKCGSAFESVLKVICQTRGWSFQPTDTASPLVKQVILQSRLEPFFEQPLMLIATLRNKLSTAHGSGSAPREVTAAKAEYAINATASAILLLVRECA